MNKKAKSVDLKRLLSIGAEPQVGQQLPGCEQAVVVCHDLGPVPVEWAGAFDVVLIMNMWQRVSWWETEKKMRIWAGCLVPGGEVHVVVPSLEWGGRMVLAEKPSGAVLPHLFGTQTGPGELHLQGFTMRRVRAELERAGIAVEVARTGSYTIIVDGEEMPAEQHYAMGRVQ